MVKSGGRTDVDRIGESEVRNDADVVSNDANARRTGVYGEFGDLAVIPGVSEDSSIS
jgi:hypothetical protein